MAITPPVAYGIRLSVTRKNGGSTLIVEVSLAIGMTSPTTIYSGSKGLSGDTYAITYSAPNDGVTRYFRATESKTGYASASSSVVSGVPSDLSVA